MNIEIIMAHDSVIIGGERYVDFAVLYNPAHRYDKIVLKFNVARQGVW